jgi:glycosyltransferase involved in cell wall biosynthesis
MDYTFRLRRWITSHFEVPSGAVILPVWRPVRLLALLAVRNHIRYLPGYVANVAAQTDGIIALDDGSDDGSAEFLSRCPAVLEVIRIPVDRPNWDEVGNHRRLVEAGLRHGAEWLISVDADERLEHRFRRRCERVIRIGKLLGYTAYGIHFRELWDSVDQYRVDGIWSRKTSARLFKARPDHQFDKRPLHSSKAPLQARVGGWFPIANLNIYHLGMLRPEDRFARRRRYETLDPEAHWQPGLGYAYLTDTRGLQLEKTPAGREYLDEASGDSASGQICGEATC